MEYDLLIQPPKFHAQSKGLTVTTSQPGHNVGGWEGEDRGGGGGGRGGWREWEIGEGGE